MLKTCFNINKRVDTRTKRTVICLYCKDNNFCISFDTDQELDEWLDLMMLLQNVNKDAEISDSTKESFGN